MIHGRTKERQTELLPASLIFLLLHNFNGITSTIEKLLNIFFRISSEIIHESRWPENCGNASVGLRKSLVKRVVFVLRGTTRTFFAPLTRFSSKLLLTPMTNV